MLKLTFVRKALEGDASGHGEKGLSCKEFHLTGLASFYNRSESKRNSLPPSHEYAACSSFASVSVYLRSVPGFCFRALAGLSLPLKSKLKKILCPCKAHPPDGPASTVRT